MDSRQGPGKSAYEPWLGWRKSGGEFSMAMRWMETSSPCHPALRICESAHTSEKGTHVVLGKGELRVSL